MNEKLGLKCLTVQEMQTCTSEQLFSGQRSDLSVLETSQNLELAVKLAL